VFPEPLVLKHSASPMRTIILISSVRAERPGDTNGLKKSQSLPGLGARAPGLHTRIGCLFL
jgi:hypothetical protein